MKLPIILTILICGSALHAADQFEEIKTTTGKTYLKVTVTKVEPDGLRIVHESGTAKLAFTDLPKDLQIRYNYDPAKAAEAGAKEAEKRAREDAYLAGLDKQTAQPRPAVPASPAPSSTPPVTAAPKRPGMLVDASLSAKTASVGREEVSLSESIFGSYDQDVFRARVVSATVQSNQSGGGDFEIFWIGSEIKYGGGSSDPKIVKTEKVHFDLIPSVPVSRNFTNLFVENEKKYVNIYLYSNGNVSSSGYKVRSGQKYVGWVVRVLNTDGRVLAVQGSRPPLIELIKSAP